jgi:hypothetical protein
MASTGLNGPYLKADIDKHVKTGKSVGVYAWGYIDGKGTFIVMYVGRSDDHAEGLNGRLHDYDGTQPTWTHFKFVYLLGEKAAFERESTIWHDFNLQSQGQIHPRRPAGTDHPCPKSVECFPAVKKS